MESIKEFKQGMDLTAKTFAGLEELLAAELKELGADDVEVIKRGCTFRGDEALLYKVNYLSRLAVRILKPIGVFGQFGSFSGISYEPHIATYFMTPAFLLTFKYKEFNFKVVISA